MNDILLTGNFVLMLQQFKETMKYLGDATYILGSGYILGIGIYRDRSRRLIGSNQSKHVDKILKRFNMDSTKKGFETMSQGIRLSKT